jgi:hypothetical protein
MATSAPFEPAKRGEQGERERRYHEHFTLLVIHDQGVFIEIPTLLVEEAADRPIQSEEQSPGGK